MPGWNSKLAPEQKCTLCFKQPCFSVTAQAYQPFTTGQFFLTKEGQAKGERQGQVLVEKMIQEAQAELKKAQITAIGPMDELKPGVLLS